VISWRFTSSLEKNFNAAKLFKGLNIAARISISAITFNAVTAYGADVRLVGDIPTSGLIFKDSLKITAFNDPKIEVFIYFVI
jgi:catabolite regulation protein CreA